MEELPSNSHGHTHTQQIATVSDTLHEKTDSCFEPRLQDSQQLTTGKRPEPEM